MKPAGMPVGIPGKAPGGNGPGIMKPIGGWPGGALASLLPPVCVPELDVVLVDVPVLVVLNVFVEVFVLVLVDVEPKH